MSEPSQRCGVTGSGSDRFVVKLENGKEVAIKQSNLKKVRFIFTKAHRNSGKHNSYRMVVVIVVRYNIVTLTLQVFLHVSRSSGTAYFQFQIH